ncbi:WD repeat-containing protein [Acrasis kona]|uniref:WD repeat-containing protein n=1 Tax=Acrasis kona TaxID=1008807 RepID=A0AAW2ZRL4_9EUKA
MGQPNSTLKQYDRFLFLYDMEFNNVLIPNKYDLDIPDIPHSFKCSYTHDVVHALCKMDEKTVAYNDDHSIKLFNVGGDLGIRNIVKDVGGIPTTLCAFQKDIIIASSVWNDMTYFFDWKSGEKICSFKQNPAYGESIYNIGDEFIIYCADQNIIVSSVMYKNKKIKVVKIASIKATGSVVCSFCPAPDRTILVGCMSGVSKVSLHTSSFKGVCLVNSGVSSIRYIGNQLCAFSTSLCQSGLMVYNYVTSEKIYCTPGYSEHPGGEIVCIAEGVIAVTFGKKIVFIDVNKKEELKTWSVGLNLRRLIFLKSGILMCQCAYARILVRRSHKNFRLNMLQCSRYIDVTIN